jgi:hypothetical protein
MRGERGKEIFLSINFIGGWLGPRSGLVAMGGKKSLASKILVKFSLYLTKYYAMKAYEV